MKVITISKKIIGSLAFFVLFVICVSVGLYVLRLPTLNVFDKVVVAIFGVYSVVTLYFSVYALLSPAVHAETKAERLELANWLSEKRYEEFVGQVKVAQIETRKCDEVVFGSPLGTEKTISNKKEKNEEITFRTGSGVDTFLFQRKDAEEFNNYLLWYFGKYLMVCHKTDWGYGKPYVKMA